MADPALCVAVALLALPCERATAADPVIQQQLSVGTAPGQMLTPQPQAASQLQTLQPSPQVPPTPLQVRPPAPSQASTPILPGGVPQQVTDNFPRQLGPSIMPATATIPDFGVAPVVPVGGVMAGGVPLSNPPQPTNYGVAPRSSMPLPPPQQVASASLGASYGASINQQPGAGRGDAPAPDLASRLRTSYSVWKPPKRN